MRNLPKHHESFEHLMPLLFVLRVSTGSGFLNQPFRNIHGISGFTFKNCVFIVGGQGQIVGAELRLQALVFFTSAPLSKFPGRP